MRFPWAASIPSHTRTPRSVTMTMRRPQALRRTRPMTVTTTLNPTMTQAAGRSIARSMPLPQVCIKREHNRARDTGVCVSPCTRMLP